MIRIVIATALVALTVAVAACGEHPCTLHVGEPTWCTATPADMSAPFCEEVCSVCEEQMADRWGTACKAHCRAEVGMQELACEQLDPAVEANYRDCIETADYPGCGGDPRGNPG